MSRVSALIACWILLGLELGLRHVFAIEFGAPGVTIAPSFLVPLLVFFCLHATAHAAVWTCVLAGIAMDLLWWPGATSGPPGAVLGLYAIGYGISGWAILRVRSVMVRKNPLTLIVLSVGFMMIAQTWITLLLGVRSIYDPIEWSVGSQLVGRIASAGLTGASALALWLVLTPLMPVFRFHQPLSRFGAGWGH